MPSTRLLPILFGLASAASAEAVNPQLPALNWQPRSDWLNVRDFGAAGDGQTDDSAAIQKVFGKVRHGTSVYLPAGTYRVTKTLTITGPAIGVQVIGHGRDTTLVWDGEAGGKLFQDNGIAHSRYVGLTFEGQGKASIGFYHYSTNRFETELLHRHLAFRNFTDAGLRAEKKDRYALAETTFDNCLFENCGRGAAFTSFNDYNWTFDGCEFRECGIGIECRHGNFYARNCHFTGSKTVDVLARPEHACSLRRCTSLGSGQFLDFANSVSPFTIQDCHVEGWKNRGGAIRVNGAPVIVFDCSFRDPPGKGAPVRTSRKQQRLIVSENVYEQGEVVAAPGDKLIYRVPAGERSGSSLSARQRFLRSEATVPSKVFDARELGAKGDGRTDDSVAIQRAIDAARAHGKGAIAYLPAGRYAIKSTLNMTGGNYAVGGSGFLSKVAWRGEEGGTMVSIREPDRLRLENISIGNHDSGKMNNAIDVIQHGGESASSMTYDRVFVYGMYQRKPFRKGLHFRNLGPQETVVIEGVQGNLRFTDCARATVLARTSFEGSVTVEGKGRERDGFLGFLTRLATITTHGLYVRDNHSVVMSDFYIEQANNGFVFEGTPGLPPGQITLQGSKLHFTVPKDRPELGTAMTLNNYQGRVFFGHNQYYCKPPEVRIRHQGTAPVELFIYGSLFYKTRLDVAAESGLKVRLAGNAGVGHVTAEGVVSPLAAAADTDPDVTVKALSRAFDDLRRLGEVELRLVYPDCGRSSGTPKQVHVD